MQFKQLNDLLRARFTEICNTTTYLFRTDVSGDTLWQTYLDSFEPGDDPVFRCPESTTHTCNNDRHFIARYGNVVGLDANYNIMTMFDVDVAGSIYEQPLD